jgi:hypothetical protein
MPEIETEVALTTFQDNCEACPELIVGGFETKYKIWTWAAC